MNEESKNPESDLSKTIRKNEVGMKMQVFMSFALQFVPDLGILEEMTATPLSERKDDIAEIAKLTGKDAATLTRDADRGRTRSLAAIEFIKVIAETQEELMQTRVKEQSKNASVAEAMRNLGIEL